MTVVWSPRSIERATEIARYIARDNPDAALKWVDSLFADVERVKDFKESGRLLDEIRRQDLRELIFGNSRIVYRIESERIAILTVCLFKQVLSTDEVRES
jgi:toxin ParE1/3/4